MLKKIIVDHKVAFRIRVYFSVIFKSFTYGHTPVSYTHLDVYKRQNIDCVWLKEYKFKINKN